MQIARIDPGGGTFAFRVGPRPGWVSSRELGLRLSCLADVVQELPDLAERVLAAEPDHDDGVGLLAPVGRPGKVLAIGLIYGEHIAEVGKPVPTEPMVFAKYSSATTSPYGLIEADRAITDELDYECELAVVIGSSARRVPEERALDHVLGYCVANDVSARDVQRRESQISRSKGLDTFCPIGPWITTVDEVPDPHRLRISTRVNGEVRQDSSTQDLLFGVPFLVSYLSRTTTLEPGDVILTGTPSGVGSGMKPPSYLREGDVVRCEVERLGWIENRVGEPGAAL